MDAAISSDDRTLDEPELRLLRRLIEAHGEVEAAAKLRISRMTIGRALAALPLQRGTLLLIRQGLRPTEAR